MTETWQLFRYREINDYFWQGLENSEFYCSSPSGLNDPFDCRLNWRTSLIRALQVPNLSKDRFMKLKDMALKFDVRDPRLDAGICCFSIDVTNLLMWAHYSKAHTGVCLYYEIPPKYFWERYPFDQNSAGNTNSIEFAGGSQVWYGDDKFTEWLTTGDLNFPIEDDHVENAVTRIFTTKAKDWEYEEEWRIVTSEPGALKFDPHFLKGVTFGIRTADSHRAQIIEIAKRNNPEVWFQQAKRSETSDFGLEFVKFG